MSIRTQRRDSKDFPPTGFERLVGNDSLDRKTGILTGRGRKAFAGPGVEKSIPQIIFDLDCMERILACSGLRPKTMRNIIKNSGFDNEHEDILIRGRFGPTFLEELVDDSVELLAVMHDCEVLLTGSRAAKYFWPRFDTSESDWDFLTHPHPLCWLKFAVYLSSIGATWQFPDNLRDDDEPPSIYETQSLRGTIEHNGKRQKLHLIAHLENQESSTQLILDFHSSFVQCFISGFGAVSMYGNLTTSGLSRVWEPEDWFKESVREANQAAVDKYLSRGIRYVRGSESPGLSHIVPVPKRRYLGDSSTICISFEDFVRESLKRKDTACGSIDIRVKMIRQDFRMLSTVRWWERHCKPFHSNLDSRHLDPQFEESYTAREQLRNGVVSNGQEFAMLVQIAECTGCDAFGSEKHFCIEHER